MSGNEAIEQRLEMNRRLLLSVALIAVLFCFWIILTRPICGGGFAASLGPRLNWSCVADGG
jgi:hypothetical protein